MNNLGYDLCSEAFRHGEVLDIWQHPLAYFLLDLHLTMPTGKSHSH